MKKVFIKLSSMFMLVGLLTLTSCEDPCKDVDCSGNGTCVDGVCVCDAGYEGAACGTRMTTKFVGSYDVGEVCTTGSYTYVASVSESATDVSRVIFTNLYDLSTLGSSETVYGTVSGNNAVAIPAQSLSNGLDFSGSGTLDEATGVITLIYSVNDGSTTDQCNATFTVQ